VARDADIARASCVSRTLRRIGLVPWSVAEIAVRQSGPAL
jgi:hypothetical protein